jgi:hypothetical protein
MTVCLAQLRAAVSWRCSGASAIICWRRTSSRQCWRAARQGGADGLSDKAARAFAESLVHEAILVDRRSGADTLSLLVHGLR